VFPLLEQDDRFTQELNELIDTRVSPELLVLFELTQLDISEQALKEYIEVYGPDIALLSNRQDVGLSQW